VLKDNEPFKRDCDDDLIRDAVTYPLSSCMKNRKTAHQNHNMEMANTYFKNVENSNVFGMTLMSQYFIHEEIKSRLNSGNTYYHSPYNIMFFLILCKNVNI
jgi:hypothetical protein